MCLAQGYNFPRIQLPKNTTSKDPSHVLWEFSPVCDGSEVIQLFSCSTEHEIYHANKC